MLITIDMKYTIVDIFKLVLFVYGANGSQLVQFDHQSILDGLSCHGNDVVITAKGFSASHCSFLCLRQALCITWFFAKDDKHCIGCSKRYNDKELLLVAGNNMAFTVHKGIYSENCNNDAACIDDFICFTDKCICEPGYYYDPGTKSCTTECKTYGNTYQDYDGWRIESNNLLQRTVTSFERCKAKCTEKSNCRSLDYRKVDKLCNLASATALTHSNFFSNISTFIYSQRNCV